MTGSVTILGANGRFGRAATAAFQEGGWQVRAFLRALPAEPPQDGLVRVVGNGFEADDVARAAEGADIIVNALNLPYGDWQRKLPDLTGNVIAAAKSSGATVMLPGNVYVFGEGMPAVLSEATPHRPTTRLGRAREQLERAYATAADHGVRAIILRGGDFIEGRRTGNWFDTHIAGKIAKGRVVYPGPLDEVHAWANLSCMARAFVGLAEMRDKIPPFAEFGFPGFAMTGQQLVEALSRAAEETLSVRKVPWWLIRRYAACSPTMRGIVEMSYLWRRPHAIDGTKLRAALPSFRQMPLQSAIDAAVSELLARAS